MHDVVIRNGKLIDGTGNPWFRGDIAIDGGAISQIGRVDGKAQRVIDADGLYVSPGFIDVHCHSDFTVLDPNNPRDFKIRQGITTEVAGQCGESAAPVNPDRLDLLKAYVAFEAPVEGILSWSWRTFDEYLRELESIAIPTNFVPLVGHGTVRIDAMGFENRPPTGAELARMKATVDEAMRAGAFGFTVGLAYAPGDYADNDEVIELAKVAAANGGMFGTHMRNYGDDIYQSLEDSFAVGRQAGLPVVISHIGVKGEANVGKIGQVLDTIQAERDAGLEVATDVYTLAAGTTLRLLLPHWVSEGTLADLFRRLRDPDSRSKMKAEMIEETKRLAADTAINRWDETFLARVVSEANGQYQGKPISEISRLKHSDPETTVMDLVLEESCLATMYKVFKQTDDLTTAVTHPLTMIETDAMGFVEGNPSVGQYGSFPRMLGYYVREKGLLRLEEAIRKMTSYAAQTMALKRKGLLRERCDADVTIFDLDNVKASLDGNKAYPTGIEYVLVNGNVVVDGGAHNGDLAGRVIRRTQA
jgi:N-acyl-D-aspartate/D-glutamate deacylase